MQLAKHRILSSLQRNAYRRLNSLSSTGLRELSKIEREEPYVISLVKIRRRWNKVHLIVPGYVLSLETVIKKKKKSQMSLILKDKVPSNIFQYWYKFAKQMLTEQNNFVSVPSSLPWYP